MKTLEEVEIYFKEKGYVVNPLSYFRWKEEGIAVQGRASEPGSIGVIALRSLAIIIAAEDNWILRTKMGNIFHDDPFNTLESLLIVAEEILGPPKEP